MSPRKNSRGLPVWPWQTCVDDRSDRSFCKCVLESCHLGQTSNQPVKQWSWGAKPSPKTVRKKYCDLEFLDPVVWFIKFDSGIFWVVVSIFFKHLLPLIWGRFPIWAKIFLMGWKLKPNKFWFRMSSSHLVVWQLFCAFPWGLWLLGPFAGAPPSQLLDDVWHCLTTAGFGVFFCCGFSFFGLVYGSRFFPENHWNTWKTFHLEPGLFWQKIDYPKSCGRSVVYLNGFVIGFLGWWFQAVW